MTIPLSQKIAPLLRSRRHQVRRALVFYTVLAKCTATVSMICTSGVVVLSAAFEGQSFQLVFAILSFIASTIDFVLKPAAKAEAKRELWARLDYCLTEITISQTLEDEARSGSACMNAIQILKDVSLDAEMGYSSAEHSNGSPQRVISEP